MSDLFRFEDLLLDKLDKITNLLDQILQKEIHMSVQLDVLEAQVAATVGVEQSVVVLLQGVVAQLQQLSADLVADAEAQAKVDALAASLDEQTDALAAAAALVPTP